MIRTAFIGRDNARDELRLKEESDLDSGKNPASGDISESVFVF